MKKLILAALLSVVGVAVITDVATSVVYAYGCQSCHYRREGCSRCHVKRTACAEPCVEDCPVCKTVVTCGPKPLQRCAKYIKVSNCCPVIKHVDISYTCGECPTGFEIDGEVVEAKSSRSYTQEMNGDSGYAATSAKSAHAKAKYVKTAE